MLELIHREAVYLWYYFSLQLRQIFGYWVLGMVLGSVISVFVKDHIHGLFRSMQGKRLGVLGIFAPVPWGPPRPFVCTEPSPWPPPSRRAAWRMTGWPLL